MTSWMIADVLVVAVLVISAYISSKKGFIKSIYKAFSIVAVLGVLFFCTTPVYESFTKTEFSQEIDSYVAESLSSDENDSTEIEPQKSVPEFLNKQVTEIAENAIIPVLSEAVKKIICILILYFVTKLILWIVFHILQVVFKLPLLGTANRLFGAAIGLVSGVIIIYVICGLISINISNTVHIREIINKTFLLKFFYDNNLLFSMFI